MPVERATPFPRPLPFTLRMEGQSSGRSVRSDLMAADGIPQMTAVDDDEAASVIWLQAPGVPDRPPAHLPRMLVEGIAAVLTVVGPLWRSIDMADSRLLLMLAVGVGASAIIGAVGQRRWLLRLLLPVAAALILLPSEGRFVSLWLAANLLLCDWALRQRPAGPMNSSPSPGAGAPVAVLLAVAAWRGSRPEAILEPTFFLGLALLVTVLSSLHGARLDRVSRSIGTAVSGFISKGAFGLLGVVLLVIPKPIHRLFRTSPLNYVPEGGWEARARLNPRVESPWGPDLQMGRTPLGLSTRKVLASSSVVAVVGLTIAGAVAVSSRVEVSSPLPRLGDLDNEPVPAAYEGEDWYLEYREDADWMMNVQAGTWRPLHTQRTADLTSRHVTVRDGHRVSWTPAPCDCRRLTVWMYGGSTTFGVGQRDEHTIASELAKAAAEEGLVVDVVNRGVLGHLHWMEAQRFAWDLAMEPPPDMVVFYDGANEVWAAQQMREIGIPESVGPVDPLLEEVWNWVKESGPPAPPTPLGATLSTIEAPQLTPEATGRLAMERYERTLKMSDDIASANDTVIRWFWQPSLFSRPPIDGEPHGAGGNYMREKRSMWRSAVEHLPDHVDNLDDVFDGHVGAIFSDDVHHNEEGARLIAAAMLDALRSDLERLAQADGAG